MKKFTNIKSIEVKPNSSRNEIGVTFKFGAYQGRSIVVDMYLRKKEKGLTFSASGYYGKGSRMQFCGQCLDSLKELLIERDGKLCETTKAILSNWERWHLNDLKAGCEHQEHAKREFGKVYEVSDVCTVCGNKYGHSWHTETLPFEFVNWFASFCCVSEMDTLK